MITVAVVAITLAAWGWVAEMNRRSREYRLLARMYAEFEPNERASIDSALLIVKTSEKVIASMRAANPGDRAAIDGVIRTRDAMRADLDLGRRRLEYDIRMKEKYARAAERPWIAVPPDPPEPR